MVVEEWRPVPGADMYDVSSLGQVRSWVKLRGLPGRRSEPRLLKQSRDESGRPVVNLKMDTGRGTVRRVHILVAAAFLGPRPDGEYVCHNNGVSSDNRVENLRYDTPLGNSRDKHAHGTHSMGERNPMARLTAEDVLEIRRRYVARYVPGRHYNYRSNAPELAQEFGTVPQNIAQIVGRHTWKHI